MAFSDRQRELLRVVLREKGLVPSPSANAIRRRASSDRAPATDLQKALWMMEQLEQQEGVYNVPSAARLRGPMDVRVLERALNEILRRHEVLRTVFISDGTEVHQVVKTHTPLPLDVVNVSDLPESDREALAQELVSRDARRRFQLESEIPFRAFLIRLAEDEHILVINIHHIVTDGYSMGVLTNELLALYSAYSKGQPSPLSELPIQFGDYAAWHRAWMTGQELDRHATFWRDALRPPLPTLRLPADKPRPTSLSGRGLHEQIRIPRDVTSRLRAFGRRHGVTVFEMLLAAFATLLHSYSGQDDIVIGSPVANRTRTELENLIGYFVNVLPFRIDLSGDPSFEQFVRRVHDVNQNVHEHQELGFGRIVELVRPPRDPSRNPVYQVELTVLEPRNTPSVYGYGFQTIAEQGLRQGDLALSPFPVESGVSKFDLTMLLWNLPGEIQGTIEYSTDLFDVRTIRSMGQRFVVLLDRTLAGPERKMSELNVALDAGSPKKIGAVKRHPLRVNKEASG